MNKLYNSDRFRAGINTNFMTMQNMRPINIPFGVELDTAFSCTLQL